MKSIFLCSAVHSITIQDASSRSDCLQNVLISVLRLMNVEFSAR